jgi:GntR family transcriptional regulator
MEFYIDNNSSTPVANQIQEQIKLAVMMEVFRKGDTLPSIRDIEKQTGINRSHIHKAYLALRKSGLLVLTRGKGTVVATAADSPGSVDEKCRKLSRSIVSKIRQMGLSPTAFARYLSRYAQEGERNIPFIWYVDYYDELAVQTAEEISLLWHVPVCGVGFQDLKAALKKRSGRVKILVSHMLCENVRALLPKNKSDVLSIEIHDSRQTMETVEKIKSNSSVLVLHKLQAQQTVQFVLASLGELMGPRGIKIASCGVRNRTHFKELLRESRYDYFFVGPAARGDVPPELRKDPRILQIHPQLDPASLEVARINAGVII